MSEYDFIKFLDNYTTKEDLTKNDFNILLKEIDNNYLSNKLDILDNK